MARKPHYVEDWEEVTKDRGRGLTRILAAAVYIFFASALPAIAFGEQLNVETKGKMTIYHTLLSTGMCGLMQSVFGGQPLLIVGVAEPIVIIYHFMDDYCTRTGIDFTAWAAWTCVWATGFLTIMAVTNLCNGIKWFTRFCGETFGMLIAILFLQQAIKGLVDEFRYEQAESYWRVMNGMFGLVLAFLYVWSSSALSQARRWRIGNSFLRAVLADYGFALSLVAMTGVSFAMSSWGDKPVDVPQRIVMPPISESVWVTSGVYVVYDMASVTVAQIFAAIIPGFVISVLFYFDHSVSSQLAQQKDFNVTRPSAYHYDLLLLALMTILCGLLGLPPVNGVLPQAPLHTRSLTSKVLLAEDEGGDQHEGMVEGTVKGKKVLKVYESRLSNFIQAALCIVLFGVAQYILKLIPTALVWAFFAFMALESLPGNQLWDRLQIIVCDAKKRAEWARDTSCQCAYLETVPYSSIAIFTLIQVTCLLGIWAITVWAGLFGISFPIFIMALVPLRALVLPKVIKPNFLSDLDAD
ncbi:bicarbonate transporter [Chloropicon primus]|uniref:Bicarbonate transporter n=1 Tax=Chloropicon primus TaxID=1764295 RepID=A0A5B8MYR8_9CHLO|nr:bicarbonate transporter [Chloropicon primus]|eukprot:QDZ25511.1 bicarbonate transporter [Chloropicon primus]